MPVQSRRGKAKVLSGAVLALAALAAVNPMTASSAQADPNSPRVNLVVRASCDRYADDSVPTNLTVSTDINPETKTKNVNTDNTTDTFGALRFRQIPSGSGTGATATVTCEDPDGNDQAYTKRLTIKRPAGTTIVQNVTIT